MITEDQPLGGFEERLLAELRDVVTARTAARGTTIAATPAARGRTRRRALAGFAAAAVVGVGVVVLSGSRDTPAYAVSKNPDGSVSLQLREFRDAAGLQRLLRAYGVAVVVDFLPNGKDCAEPR